MCGRYSLAGPNPAQVRALYPVDKAVPVRRRYNVAPGDDVLAVIADGRHAPRGDLLRWGLVPAWASTPTPAATMINARAETVQQRPAFRDLFSRRRCLILADGFYEWQRTGARRQAFHIQAAERSLFAFAGLWTSWRGSDVATLRTCTILTTAANTALATVHDRMPVILPREAEAAWLDPGASPAQLRELLGGMPAAGTVLRPVGSAVNDARCDGPECLDEPVEAQTALF